ncbi:RluA family pseudouridine synthase [Bdellovibrio svalbardensis]|uniref:RNA pseudouridine synthase n=1 Tax=Bdellovibrio svalbardensis TaxID=2972972 RepID=A0ABT6DNU4_9BACT|nr:RNA pseudouridine synthase [Bdellovibrio svalbardensis]MDG0817594.1 RNA pseudouridine synthase [Bdellovibrio svalbardensis]
MIEIVFENSHFVVCDKPSGVLSTPSRFEEEDARLCLGTALQEHLKIQIYPVHRLDYEVSGLVMYAKNPDAHRKANAWFEMKQVQKTYRALTTKQDFAHIPSNITNPRTPIELQPGLNFEWKSRLLRGKRRAYEHAQGKPSLTLVTYLGESDSNNEHYLQWDLQPVTGRSHQLRFDLSRHGFPIVGDALYGSKVSWKSNDSIALRSYAIDFAQTPGAEALSLPKKIVIPAL